MYYRAGDNFSNKTIIIYTQLSTALRTGWCSLRPTRSAQELQGTRTFHSREGYPVDESRILANNNENGQPTCIYRCGKGGIHVFYGYVNIGMPPEHFRRFTEAVVGVLNRITDGDWDGYVTLHYGTTALILPQEEFIPFAVTIREAAKALEVPEAGDKTRPRRPEAVPDHFCDPVFQPYDGNRLN